ncbi:Serine/arginine-rich splicing factor like [Actinidia chinensis var. chinensis]|uniref:Serine/arginine-rich splicing factor like n=1 Tax=Actinidia chinensis var. chinensis TaxID=1590841 RepID=A0A2R6RSV6_ACTCC|nr:Serine/arginine-rich splicing factor like [Actinidia chinensis var. chinensis]
MRPIFCGNFDYDARQSDLERLFKKYGKVDRVDMKSGFAFVYMDDERDAEDAIRGLDRMDFGRKGRRLRVEWTKQERGPRRPESTKRSSTNTRPSKTLFVINFDPYNTRTRDLERHFDPYGKILNVRIRRNFAFIQYESQEDAIKALDATNMSKLMDRVISVEYAIKDDDDRRNGHSPDRSRDRSPGRRGQDRGQSLSPYRRERASPDYGRGRSPSPYRRGRASPDYGRGPSPSPHRKEKTNSDHGRSPRRERHSPDHGRERSPRQRVTPDYGHGSPSPQRERINRDNYQRDPSPDSKHELRDIPKYDGEDSPPHERYRSRSPLARERSRS